MLEACLRHDGLGIDDPVWDHSTYSKNRDRLLEADVAKKFLKAILAHRKVAPLLSDDHFTVDGTAWASMKTLLRNPPEDGLTRRRARPLRTLKASQSRRKAQPAQAAETPMPTTDASRTAAGDMLFTARSAQTPTHASTTDPEARLSGKAKARSQLSYIHATPRTGSLVVETEMTQATGTAEREAAKTMIESHAPGSERKLTVGADKAYDTADFVAGMRQMCVTPHVAQNDKGRASAIDARTTRHQGYAVSQKKRKLIEEAFGWGKTIGGLARPMRKGKARMGFVFTFTMAAYDLVRLPRLLAEANA